jgi:hypothetical protein
MGMTREERAKALHIGSEIEQYMIVDVQSIIAVGEELEGLLLTRDAPTVAQVEIEIDELHKWIGILRTHASQQDFVRWLRHKRRQARGIKQYK